MRSVSRSVSALGFSLSLLLTLVLAAGSALSRTEQDQPPAKKAGKAASKKKTGKATKSKKSIAKEPAAEPAMPADPKAKAAANDDPNVLKFSRDIAPIFVANCMSCHNAERKRGQFDLSTFKKLMMGAKGGGEKVLIAGDPAESILVQHIKGELDPKMPPGNRVLAAEAIVKIESWVKAGALLDAGIDADALLSKIAATPEAIRQSRLAQMSPEERDAKTVATGLERWKKAVPLAKPEPIPSPHFLLVSILPPGRAGVLTKDLERQYSGLKTMLSRPNKPALEWAEKLSLYVFSDRRSYVEFVRTFENREVEEGIEAHGNLGLESPYLAAVDPLAGHEGFSTDSEKSRSRSKKDEGGPPRSLLGLLVEQLGVAAVNQSGKPPRWLSLGMGAYLASKVEPRSPYYRRLRNEVKEQYNLGWTSKATDVLGGQADDAKIRALGFSLVECLAVTPKQLTMFTRGMLDGQEKLDEGVRVVFGLDNRESFLIKWGQFVVTKYGGSR